MGSQARHRPAEDERHYYALNRVAWRLLAPFYDAITFPLKTIRRGVAIITGVDRDSRVLDVATGTGAQALAFAARGAKVVGVDLSDSMLRIARRKVRGPSLIFARADAIALPFENDRFDVCCVSFGLHEMPPTVRDRALSEITRVTKPNGKIVVVDYGLPKGPIARRVVYQLVRLYERDNYEEFIRSDLHSGLERAGIAVVTDRLLRPGLGIAWWSPVRVVIGSNRKHSLPL